MSNPEQMMQLARDLAEEVVGVAGELLLSDADVEHVQRRYTMPVIELLSEAEALGILAGTGDRYALAALHRVTSRLAGLKDEALAERTDQADEDNER
ncbi:MAG TPA: hypothetical protein VK790_01225 [Solirubrobacteraceae bacterium]|jgi:hypothetical protein|nr:hypothetical protein [Solirubrobacteraceae bacterium]